MKVSSRAATVAPVAGDRIHGPLPIYNAANGDEKVEYGHRFVFMLVFGVIHIETINDAVEAERANQDDGERRGERRNETKKTAKRGAK